MKRLLCLALAAIMLAALISCTDSENAGKPDTASGTVGAGVADATDEAYTGDVGAATALRVMFYGEGEDTEGRELSVWSRDLISAHKDANAPKSASVNILGKEFTGEYQYSAVYYPATHLSHCYSTGYGSFSVNAENGALDAFNASYEVTEELASVDDCRERATEAAKQFINIDDYTLEVIEADPEHNRTSHIFRWTKHLLDMPTGDMFSIGLSIYGGGISSIGCSLVGSFEATPDNVRAARRLMSADVETAVREKVAERFGGVEYDLWIGDLSVVSLPDGTVAIKTTVEVTRNESDVSNGETYYYPHTSAYDTYIFEDAGN